MPRTTPDKAVAPGPTTRRQIALLQAARRRSHLRVLALAGTGLVLLLLAAWTLSRGGDAELAAKAQDSSPSLPREAKRGPQRSMSAQPGARPGSALEERALEPPRARSEDQQVAAALASDKRGAVQLCFERELKRNPRLRGTVTVRLELKAPRALERVEVMDTLRRPEFTRCVAETMRRVQVPPLREDLTVELPFRLVNPEI